MTSKIVLASGSEIRRKLLENAGVPFDVSPVRVDEESIKFAMMSENAPPRDIADTLAEMKARKGSAKIPEKLVIGCDQVLALGDEILSKPETEVDAIRQLQRMRGKMHELHSAAVIYETGKPIWRMIGTVKMSMRQVSDAYIASYVERNWDSIRDAVGAYKLEEEGVRLFSNVIGDYFHVLGIPLLELLSYLSLRGDLET